MDKFFVILGIAAVLTGCTTVPQSEIKQFSQPPHPKWGVVSNGWTRIWCYVKWGHKCEVEAAPQNEIVIPKGWAHCYTAENRISGPANTASSWWELDGDRVRVYARACGGPFWDQYGSWVDVKWETWIVPAGLVSDPANHCNPVKKGGIELFC